MDDLLTEFLTETSESLEVVDSELVRFEREPNNSEILDNVFRLVHTIKGTCGFLGLPRLESLAHAAETLMGHYRDGAKVSGGGVSIILNSIDRIKIILGELEASQKEPEGGDVDLIDQLLALAGVETETNQQALADAAVPIEDPAGEETIEDPAGAPIVSSAEEQSDVMPVAPGADLLAVDLDQSGPMGRPLKPGEVSMAELEAAFAATEGPEMRPSAPEASKTTIPNGAINSDTKLTSKVPESSIANQTIRVAVQTIETLMTMVSELVLTRNQLLEISRRHQDSEFDVPLQRLSNVTAELQEGVMKTRMQPIGNAWGKLPRIVRDLSMELGRPIELKMNGAETELDRQVLELIRDPLTHMVRNSADHGIEPPEVRKAAGKTETGTVEVSAYHEGGHIIIEIADDGKGLNTEKLREAALKKEVVTEAELEDMSDAQIHKLIFHPGFSTAEKVTSVSGRGVGMDVVRTNIDQIGGSIDLTSVEGQGTTVKIKIPLTLAIIPALIIECGGDRIAIPQLAVTELVRAHPDGPNKIEKLKKAEVLRLRKSLLPLVRLSELLEMEAQQPDPDETPNDSTFVVVAKVGQQDFGIVVDEVFHTEEIVVKPMSGMLKEVSMFSGNTIMGDGSVIMILDPNGIARAVGQVRPDESSEDDEGELGGAEDAAVSLLVFESGDQSPKAVPLSLVTRLEEFEVASIECSGDRHLVQYRGRLMPLVYADGSMKERSEGSLPMLVFSEGERSMGLVVDRIVDIVEAQLDLHVQSRVPGFLGSAIVAGRATDILDIAHFLPLAFSDWFERKERNASSKQRILYVEDSAFFRNMTVPALQGAGYDVTVCEDGIDAHERVMNGELFDLVITDIEMPNMDGFTLATMLKNHENAMNWPIIALSAFSGPNAEARATEVGMFAYVAKFDRQGLLDALVAAGQMRDVEMAA